MKTESRIRILGVTTTAGNAGQLQRDSRFVFAYAHDAPKEAQVSVTMPIRVESYCRGALFPIFEMNLPEGYVRHYITERLRKQRHVDDMLFLALSGSSGVGRISYNTKQLSSSALQPTSMADILRRDAQNEIFRELVERYLIQTTAGVSGMQPKVVVPEQRGTLCLPSIIVKSGEQEYPGIAVNEFVCMQIAKQAGLQTPDFWISEDQKRFVMRRFDLLADGSRRGMEDFSVLMARPGELKYRSSYENLLKVCISIWTRCQSSYISN